MDFSQNILFDGGMGTMLQARGLCAGELPELWNIERPSDVTAVHRAYVTAGADVITANTFGANSFKISGGYTVTEVVTAAINNARSAGAKHIALDLGPTGVMLEPLGDKTFDDICGAYSEAVIAAEAAGADLVIIETMSDLLEAKAAVIAVKEKSHLPFIVSMTFDASGKTIFGTSPEVAAVTLSSLGAAAVGVNCSLGPKELKEIVARLVKYSPVPVIVQANAGLPRVEGGKTFFPVGAEEYAAYAAEFLDMGVSVLGGCCGTTPEYTGLLRKLLDTHSPAERSVKRLTAFTSASKLVSLDGCKTAVIGERINPTGKKLLKQALREKNYSYVLDEAIRQELAGADVLDVNAGLPEIDEKETLVKLVKLLQGATPLPLQIDTSDPNALEAAVRVYNGKPIINSVNGKDESLNAVLPVAAKYGASVVALTLDESGIPDSAEGRLLIAEKILKRAADFGIPKEDIIVDCLVLTASTNQAVALETLKAIKLVKQKLGLKTVLGVSNISFGLPSRNIFNSAFLAEAYGAGLDMPILNPLAEEYRQVVAVHRVLNCEDTSAARYIEKYGSETNAAQSNDNGGQQSLKELVVNGRSDLTADAVSKLLITENPVDIINNHFIPALDEVGEKYEKGIIYLPQLMAAAEAVKCGFDIIRSASATEKTDKGTILLATVMGDIHDIGKNIVHMMLENYGYSIIDLGRDVPPEAIVDETRKGNIKLVGLSALMTTTVKNMELTVKLLHDAGLDCKIMVGGAVLTPEYAKLVGADYYSKDAAQAVKIAKEVFNN